MNEHSGLSKLIQAMTEQTAAISRLAQSNEALVQAMAENEGIDDDDQGLSPTYLNGTQK